MNKCFTVAVLTALTTVLAIPSFAQAQQSQSSFAVGHCQIGCVIFNTHPSTIYSGAVPKSYRICSVDTFIVRVTVDNRLVEIAGRDCADVNGSNILLQDGTARAGRLPE